MELREMFGRLSWELEFPWDWESQPEELKEIFRDSSDMDFTLAYPDEGGVIYVKE